VRSDPFLCDIDLILFDWRIESVRLVSSCVCVYVACVTRGGGLHFIFLHDSILRLLVVGAVAMALTSLLLDGKLINIDVEATLCVENTTPLHHCVVWSTHAVSVKIPLASLALNCEAGKLVCGTFIISQPMQSFIVVVEVLQPPLSVAERFVIESIVEAAQAQPTKNRAVPMSLISCRARKCTKLAANWCPQLASFTENNEEVCVVRQRITRAKRQPPIIDFSRSAVATLFEASFSQALDWRKCAVSFSTIMRFFQRDKSFKWQTPYAAEQPVISLK